MKNNCYLAYATWTFRKTWFNETEKPQDFRYLNLTDFNSLYIFLMLLIIHGCVFRVLCVNYNELIVVPLYHGYANNTLTLQKTRVRQTLIFNSLSVEYIQSVCSPAVSYCILGVRPPVQRVRCPRHSITTMDERTIWYVLIWILITRLARRSNEVTLVVWGRFG